MRGQPDTVVAGSKRCRCCGRVKPLERFARHARTADRRQAWCRNCNRITRAIYRANGKLR